MEICPNERLSAGRDIIVRLLETDSGNLHRFYKRNALGRARGEDVLDTVKLYVEAGKIFDDRELAREWLHSEVLVLCWTRSPVVTWSGKCCARSTLGSSADARL